MQLGEAYRLALQQSEQVHIAASTRDLAETTYTEALTAMGPNIIVSSRGVYQNRAVGVNAPGEPSTGVLQPYYFNANVTLTQPIIRRNVVDVRRAARIGIQSADQSLQRTRQQLMFDVASVFIAVLSARQQITISQSAIRRAETQVQNAAGRVKAGGALPTATLLAQIELNRAQTSANTALGNLRAQESDFERLVGVRPPENLVLPPTPKYGEAAEALRTAPMQRADLRALRLTTLQTKATVTAIQNLIFWPTFDVNLFAGYTIQSTSNGVPADYRFPIYGVSGVLSVPLLSGGHEWTQLKSQRQRVSISADQESFLRRQISDDVRTAIARLETAVKSIEIATEQQRTAQKNYDLVSTHYKLGVSTLLELVTAQQAVFEAESNKALASYERELSTYQLLFAEGNITM